MRIYLCSTLRRCAFRWLTAAFVCIVISSHRAHAATQEVVNLVSQGNALYFGCDYEGAKAKYLEALALDATYATAHSNLGLTYGRLGDFPNALASINQAVTLDPADKRHQLNLGKVQAMQALYSDAITSFTAAVSIDANYAKAYYDRAWCYDAWGDTLTGAERSAKYDSAVGDYTTAILKDAAHVKAMIGLAITRAKQGNQEDAVWWCKRAIAASSGTGTSLNMLARQNLHVMRGADFTFDNAASPALFAEALSLLTRDSSASVGIDTAVTKFAQLSVNESDSALAHYMYSRALSDANPSDPLVALEYQAAKSLLPRASFTSSPDNAKLFVDFYNSGWTPADDRLFPAPYDVTLNASQPYCRCYLSDKIEVTAAGPNDFLWDAFSPAATNIATIIDGSGVPDIPNYLEPGRTLRINLARALDVLRLREFAIATAAELQECNIELLNNTGFFSGDELDCQATLSATSPHITITKDHASSEPGDDCFEFLPLASLESDPQPVEFLLSWTTPYDSGSFVLRVSVIVRHHYYVNDSSPENDNWCTEAGNDANDGRTPSSPKASVQAILDDCDLGSGDIVHIDTGYYALTGDITVVYTDAGSPGGPVTFEASPYGVTIDRGDVAGYGWRVDADYVTITTATSNVHPAASQHWMTVKQGYYGIFLDVTRSARVSRCAFYDNEGGGIWISSCTASTVDKCIVSNATPSIYARGIDLGGGTQNTLKNCVVYGGFYIGIAIWPGDNLRVHNNIVWIDGVNKHSVYINGDPPYLVSDYNDLYATGGASVGYNEYGTSFQTLKDWQTAYGQEEHSISADPLFADPAAGDFHLKSRTGRYATATGLPPDAPNAWVQDSVFSPAVDGGYPFSPCTQEPAPNGAVINMGAYGNTEQASKSSPVFAVITPALPPGKLALVYETSLSALGGTRPYLWSIASGSLPDGLALTPAGMISGTPVTAGTWDFTVRATDSSTPPAAVAKPLSLTVVGDLLITTTSLPRGQIGVPYNQAVSTTGGLPPFTWLKVSGSFPAGLSLNSSTGVISGTPTASGTYNCIIRVTDSWSPADTDDQSLSINIPMDLTVTTTALADGTAGVVYSRTLLCWGGVSPYTWTIDGGSLPAGLGLSPSGVISGTPTASGTSNFTVKVTDSQSPPDTAIGALSITVYFDLVITTTSLPRGQIGVPYSQTVTATGGLLPYTWSKVYGSFPAGLDIDASTGIIAGTPTTAGTSYFTVRVNDSRATPDSYDKYLSITIPSDLLVTTTALANGTVGVSYSRTLSCSGGVSPYAWTLDGGTLPAGLSLSPSGVISGTPTASGTSNFTVKVTDSQTPADTATKALSIFVNPGDLVITATSLPNGQIGLVYSQALTASGGVPPYAWSLVSGNLPPGLSLGPATGVISGTPTAPGTYNFTVRVTDSQSPADTATSSLSIYVQVDLTVATASLPNGQIGVAYNQTLAASGGITPYSWSLAGGTLPPGLSLSPAGAISGTPTATGTSNFTVLVADSQTPADTATRALSIIISSLGTVLTPVFTPAAPCSFASSVDVTITCGTAGATIYYTTSGDDPTASSTLYTGPVHITATTTLKAIACKPAMVDSPVASGVYTRDPAAPTVSSVATLPTSIREGIDLSLTLMASASDVSSGGSNIVAAEYFIGSDPGFGNGVPMQPADGAFNSPFEALVATVPTASWTIPNRKMNLRARDAASNWSTAVAVIVDVVDGAPPGKITNLTAEAVPSLASVPVTLEDSSSDYVTYDAGEIVEFGAVSLAPLGAPSLFPKNFAIAVSQDNTSWQTVAEARTFKAGAAPYLWQFEPVDARYVRVSGPGVYGAATVTVYESLGAATARLVWTAPADDGYAPASGSADRYDVRHSANPITALNFDAAARTLIPSPKTPGSPEAAIVPINYLTGTVFFAMKTADEIPNWSEISNVASLRSGVTGFVPEAPDDGVQAAPAVAPTFVFGVDSNVTGAAIRFSSCPGFPPVATVRIDGQIDKCIRFALKTTAVSWTPNASQWKAIKALACTEETIWWRLEGKHATYGTVFGPARHFLFDCGEIYDLDVEPSHDKNGDEAVWPDKATPPTFSWTYDGSGIDPGALMTWFWVDISTDESVPFTDRKKTVTVGGPGITAWSRTLTAAEWKKVRQLATKGGGALYWRVRGKDSAKVLECASGVKKLVVDGGTLDLAPFKITVSPCAPAWTHDKGPEVYKYYLEFSTDDSFDRREGWIIKMPGPGTLDTTYTLPEKVAAALLKRTENPRYGATVLYCRVRAEDADKAFVTHSDTVEVWP